MQAQESAAQAAQEAAQAAAHGGEHAASGAFNAGETIIEHVSNSSLEHPLIHLPTIAGIDLSVTKHVFMLWLVAAIVFIVVDRGRAAIPEPGPAGADGLHERPRGGRAIRARRRSCSPTSDASG